MTSRACVVAGLAIAVTVSACTDGSREARPFEGIWQSRGVGIYLDIDGQNADVYEYTSVHCVLVYAGPTRGISDVVSLDGDELVLTDAGRVIRFEGLAALPGRCAEESTTHDARRVVEVAAATIAELYQPGVDEGWSVRLETSIEIDSVDPAATFAALTGLLEPLGDPGVRLVVDDPTTWAGVWAAGGGPLGGREPYVPPGLGAVAVTGEQGLVVGSFGAVAYFGFARLGRFGGDDDESQRVLAAELDAVLTDADALILDLRGVASGSAVEAMLVASRFVPDERLVATHMIGSTPAGDLTVHPNSSGPYPGHVAVLIGPGTAGAGEMLALAMRYLPGVSLIGETTAGSPTGPLARMLPNGWSLGVPALDLVTTDGVSLTGVGLEPDIVIATSDADLDAGLDPGIERALSLLGMGH